MAELNLDMMKAKVPLWFQKLSGWESRLVAVRAEILLIFGIKPDTADGSKCLEALDQVVLDFLTGITSRPDRKINKGLMTQLEEELQQAKMTITQLKDTTLRQDMILQQYAEESRYYKQALSRRDADLGLQRSQLLTEILKLKGEITRLQIDQSAKSPGDGSQSVGGGGGAVSASANSGANKKTQHRSDVDRKTIIKLQSELKEVRKEAASLNKQNGDLMDQMAQLGAEKDEDISELTNQLLAAGERVTELEEQIQEFKESRKLNPAAIIPAVCGTCSVAIQEPQCEACQATQIQKELAASTSTTQEMPIQQAGDMAAARPSGFSKFAAAANKVRNSSRLLKTAVDITGHVLKTPTPPAANASTGMKKKAWSFEKDIEAWRDHCDKLVASEIEKCEQKVNEKELDLEQLMHVALQGRIETYQELSDIECNHWQPQLMEIRLKLFEVSSAYEMLCQEVQEDLEDLFIFVAARKLTYTEEKVGLAKKEQEYTKFIEKQLKTIKGLRKDNRAMKKELQEKTRAFELNKTQIALEMRQHEANMFEKRQMVREAGAKIKRLEYQIAQLQGKVVPGLSNLQENRIQRIQSLDFRQARERKDLLSREEPSHIKDIDLLCSLKDSVDEKLGQLRKVFGANILDSDNDEDKNINASTEDGEHQEPSKNTTKSVPKNQPDVMKLKMEISTLKKENRKLRNDIDRRNLHDFSSPVASPLGSVRRDRQARSIDGDLPRTGSRSPSHSQWVDDTTEEKVAIGEGKSILEKPEDLQDPMLRYDDTNIPAIYSQRDERCQSLSDASTQTTASWKQGDEQNTSMLPSKNSSSVPMKVSQGANMPTQMKSAWELSAKTLHEMALRNSSKLGASQGANPPSRPSSARYSGRIVYSTRGSMSSASDDASPRWSSHLPPDLEREPVQGSSYSRNFSIEHLQEPSTRRPISEIDNLLVTGVPSPKTTRDTSTRRGSSSIARRLSAENQMQVKKIPMQINTATIPNVSKLCDGMDTTGVSPSPFPVRTSPGWTKSDPH